MRRGVVSLVPKGGDRLNIKNWRPITLLNTDYKLLTKVLTSRLKRVINSLVQPEQTYCVPGRTIHDNLHLLRDTIWYGNTYDVPLAIITLDQEKAFDRVNHDYLLQKKYLAKVFLPV